MSTYARLARLEPPKLSISIMESLYYSSLRKIFPEAEYDSLAQQLSTTPPADLDVDFDMRGCLSTIVRAVMSLSVSLGLMAGHIAPYPLPDQARIHWLVAGKPQGYIDVPQCKAIQLAELLQVMKRQPEWTRDRGAHKMEEIGQRLDWLIARQTDLLAALAAEKAGEEGVSEW